MEGSSIVPSSSVYVLGRSTGRSHLKLKHCDQIELRIKEWLERPEAERKKLKEERERERRERLEAWRRETADRSTSFAMHAAGGRSAPVLVRPQARVS